jgi:aminoglycoside phosphotransferase
LHLPDPPTDRRDRLIRPAIRRIRGALRHRFAPSRGISEAERAAILAVAASARASAATWRVLEVRPGDPVLVTLGVDAGVPVAYLRLAREPNPVAGLLAAETAQRALAGRLEGIVPAVIAAGSIDGARWLVESAVAGESGSDRALDAAGRQRAVAAVLDAVRPLHETARARVVGDAEIERWIGDGLRIARNVTDGSPATTAWLARTERRVVDGLRGRTLRVGWIHGDLWLDNDRFAPDEDRVTGIVDWDSAGPDDLALHDLVHLALTTRRRALRHEYGSVLHAAIGATRDLGDEAVLTVGALLDGGASSDRAGEPVSSAIEARIEAGGLDPESILLLAWLRFVATNVRRHPELRRRRQWIDANVRAVIE